MYEGKSEIYTQGNCVVAPLKYKTLLTVNYEFNRL